ncbi:MAG: hypothetical protein BAJALOKI3v1_30021 [Promethearchaeota archaeon]|nr:MAG: hypothetical protein BAJALOKI3v1_30021 [Candidatus Lokiarchaeota archaeon]
MNSQSSQILNTTKIKIILSNLNNNELIKKNSGKRWLILTKRLG